jgi:hypothetical protein
MLCVLPLGQSPELSELAELAGLVRFLVTKERTL